MFNKLTFTLYLPRINVKYARDFLPCLFTLCACAFACCRSKKSKRKFSQKVLIDSNETTDPTEPQSGEGVKPKSTREFHVYLVFPRCGVLRLNSWFQWIDLILFTALSISSVSFEGSQSRREWWKTKDSPRRGKDDGRCLGFVWLLLLEYQDRPTRAFVWFTGTIVTLRSSEFVHNSLKAQDFNRSSWSPHVIVVYFPCTP